MINALEKCCQNSYQVRNELICVFVIRPIRELIEIVLASDHFGADHKSRAGNRAASRPADRVVTARPDLL
jgi:hypothetical protein